MAKPKDVLGLSIGPEISEEEIYDIAYSCEGLDNDQCTEDMSEYRDDLKEFDKLKIKED